MLDRYSPAELIGFARCLDPGLTPCDFADAGRQLDHINDEAFTRFGLSAGDVTALRDKFAAWPRTIQAASGRLPAAEPPEPASADRGAGPGRELEPGR